MGCISSRVIARSLSYHEERKKASQRTTSNNGIPSLEDIIKSANNSSDHYLALVLHSKSFSSNAASKQAIHDEPVSSEAIDKLEISTSPVEDQEGGKQQIGTTDQRKRSKSCHLFLPEHVLSSLARENSSGDKKIVDLTNEFWLSSAGVISRTERSEFNSQSEPKLTKENGYDLNSKSDVGSRSFHTVEEYDDLVRKLWLSKSHRFQQCEFTDTDDICSSETNMDLLVSESVLSSTTHDPIENKDPAIKGKNSSDIKEEKIMVPIQKNGVPIEKGNKRKAIAKRLESLSIPSSNSIECPAIASLKEWIPTPGNIYSPGSYVTPKFGSYSSLMAAGRSACESREDSSSIFSPELVSAFEQCMQKLEAEEENILKQITANFEEENGGQIMKSQERNP